MSDKVKYIVIFGGDYFEFSSKRQMKSHWAWKSIGARLYEVKKVIQVKVKRVLS